MKIRKKGKALLSGAMAAFILGNTSMVSAMWNGRKQTEREVRARQARERLERTFQEAAGNGDLQTVRNCISQGVSVNANGGSALINAARSGNLEIVKYLVDHGADVNKGDALGYAASSGHLDIVKFLNNQRLINDGSQSKPQPKPQPKPYRGNSVQEIVCHFIETLDNVINNPDINERLVHIMREYNNFVQTIYEKIVFPTRLPAEVADYHELNGQNKLNTAREYFEKYLLRDNRKAKNIILLARNRRNCIEHNKGICDGKCDLEMDFEKGEKIVLEESYIKKVLDALKTVAKDIKY